MISPAEVPITKITAAIEKAFLEGCAFCKLEGANLYIIMQS